MSEQQPIDHTPFNEVPKDSTLPLETEFVLPPNVAHKFLFKRHIAPFENDYYVARDELYYSMSEIFKPKQKNILLNENFGGPNEVVLTEYPRRKSMREAVLIASVLASGQAYPTSNSIKETMKAYKDRIKLVTDPAARYGYARAHAIDMLLSRGIRIELQHEQPTPEAEHFYDRVIANSAEEYELMMREYAEGSALRDRTVAKQIETLTMEMANSGQQVNILTLFGTSHAGIVKLLPAAFNAEDKTEIDTKILGLGFMDEVNKRLVTGENIPSDLWKSAYQEYLQSHTFHS